MTTMTRYRRTETVDLTVLAPAQSHGSTAIAWSDSTTDRYYLGLNGAAILVDLLNELTSTESGRTDRSLPGVTVTDTELVIEIDALGWPTLRHPIGNLADRMELVEMIERAANVGAMLD